MKEKICEDVIRKKKVNDFKNEINKIIKNNFIIKVYIKHIDHIYYLTFYIFKKKLFDKYAFHYYEDSIIKIVIPYDDVCIGKRSYDKVVVYNKDYYLVAKSLAKELDSAYLIKCWDLE